MISTILTFFYLYLKRRNQWVNIKIVHSMFQILGPLLFNLFINHLFYFIKDAQLLYFVDDLITEPQKESEKAIDWYCSNEMVVNPDKFQSITFKRLGKLKDSIKFLINNHEIDSGNSVKL